MPQRRTPRLRIDRERHAGMRPDLLSTHLRCSITRSDTVQVQLLTASTGQHGLAVIWGFWWPDSPIPIPQASFCCIARHIGIPTFFLRIGDRLS